MLFNSIEFFLFFPVVTALYFLLPPARRWLLLLAASCIFYLVFIPKFIFVPFLTITVAFTAGLLFEKTPPGLRRRVYFLSSLILILSILGYFKYFNFLNDNIAALARLIHWNYGIGSLKIILPIGLSFYTFQALSYVIEAYRGAQNAERHFGIFALYILFYPQLVAGPIERPQNLLSQFREIHTFEYDRVTGGLKRMAFGLFKKVVIADQLAPLVNQVYSHPHDYSGLPLLLATVCFSYQIYCDFSGYCDIALGSAQVMGFRLSENFDRPYASRSVAEFWRRWHITLMNWFRDYVYIPLGGNRVAKPRWVLNILVVFLISGLWHGADWTFVLWGALNGGYLILSRQTSALRAAAVRATHLDRYPRVHHALQVCMTFLLISYAWIFFRADTLHDAFSISAHVFDGLARLAWRGRFAFDGFLLVFILFMEYVQYRHRDIGIRNLFSGRPVLVRWSLYYLMTAAIVVFGAFSRQRFIYFQF